MKKLQTMVLTSNEKAAIKGGVWPEDTHLPEAQVPVNGIYYPCGLPVVSHP